MPLQQGIRPEPGQVFICDFGPDPDSILKPGVMRGPLAVKPEIWKERHVVALSSSFGTTTVAPFSTKAPRSPSKVHHRIPAGTYPFMDQHEDSWLKGDLITTVSNDRLERPYVGDRRTVVKLTKDDLRAVRKAVLNALRLGVLAPHLDPPLDPQAAGAQSGGAAGSASTPSPGSAPAPGSAPETGPGFSTSTSTSTSTSIEGPAGHAQKIGIRARTRG